jgi:hypothetical protein
MYLSFSLFAVFTSALFASIASVWMFAPKRFTSAWRLSFADSTGLVGRRAAALYYGIAVMFFVARNVENSITRHALVYGLMTTCVILAFLGAYEFKMQRAGKGILMAVLIEIFLCLLGAYHIRFPI